MKRLTGVWGSGHFSGLLRRPALLRKPIGRLRAPGRSLPYLLLLVFLLPACRQEPAIGSDVVVSIEGDEVAYSRFESYLRGSVDSSDLPLPPKVLDQLFDQFLDEQLLVRLALDGGFESPADEAVVDPRRAMAYLLREARAGRDLEARVERYYEDRKEEFERPESVRLQQILVHERPAAEEAKAALAAGEEFRQVAARFSQVPMTHLGGEQGRLGRDDLPEALADVIFALEPGETSDIVTADYGFHIFQVLERFPAEAVPFSEAAGQIRQALERRHVDELVASFIAEARSRYHVKVHLSNFPFDYQGFYAHENDI